MFVSKAVWESKTSSPRLDTKDLGAKFGFLTSQMERNQKNSMQFLVSQGASVYARTLKRL